MWWAIVFWLLLIPLLIVEVFIYVKTKRLYWLVYALAMFTYTITVSYTLDVFNAGRNAIILTLLLSSGLMAFLGHQIGRPSKRRAPSRRLRNLSFLIGIVLITVFVLSVLLGKSTETVLPVDSVKASQVVTDGKLRVPDGDIRAVRVLTRRIRNDFFLPVPVETRDYLVCLETAEGLSQMYASPRRMEEEVPPKSTLDVMVSVRPALTRSTPQHVLIYEGVPPYESCDEQDGPTYTIPVV